MPRGKEGRLRGGGAARGKGRMRKGFASKKKHVPRSVSASMMMGSGGGSGGGGRRYPRLAVDKLSLGDDCKGVRRRRKGMGE